MNDLTPSLDDVRRLDEVVERRYIALVRLGSAVAAATGWEQLTAAVAGGLGGEAGDGPPVRLWTSGDEGPVEAARHPPDQPFPRQAPRDLRRAARLPEPVDGGGGSVLCGLVAAGARGAVLEVCARDVDRELLRHAAPVVASRVALVDAQDPAGGVVGAASLAEGSDIAAVMGAFAAEAKRLLEHDRLSAYLLTPDGGAVERFAVATSAIVPGEGVVVPLEEFGLRHILHTNRPLVSEDLTTDPRIVGREDRVIARAGYHGLLSAPLRLAGRPFGVLNFVSRTPGFYREEDAPVAEQLADQIGVFIENLRLQQRSRTWLRHSSAEHERARLARELHDTLAQVMPDFAHTAERLSERLRARDPAASIDARTLANRARMAQVDVRRALLNLVPPALESHALEEVMETELRRLGEDDGAPRAMFALEGSTNDLHGSVRRAVYRIFQEALVNIRHHAHANHVAVALRVGDRLQLSVEDDGIGFDVDRAAGGRGLGIQFMRDRARALGGTLEVDSAPRRGTRLELELPAPAEVGDESLLEESLPPAGVREAPQVARRVLIADGHALIRAGLLQVLGAAGTGLRIVGDAATLTDAREQAARLRPEVIVLDLAVAPAPDLALSAMRAAAPRASIVALSEIDHVDEVALVAAGASRIIRKSAPPEELLEAVRRAGFEDPGEERGRRSTGHDLTDHERTLLRLIAAGRTNTEMGEELFRAAKTIERQVAAVIRKLGARNRSHAAALAVAEKIVEPPRA